MILQFLAVSWYTYMYLPCSVPLGSGRADYFAIDCTASQLADMTRAEGEGRGNVVLANKH